MMIVNCINIYLAFNTLELKLNSFNRAEGGKLYLKNIKL